MFQLFLNGRPAGNKKHSTYEKARQAVRKLIRKNKPAWAIFTTGNNPAYTAFGYTIRRI